MNSTDPRHTAILASIQQADRGAFLHPDSDQDELVTLATWLASEAVCGNLADAVALAEEVYGIPAPISHMLAAAALPVLYPVAARVLHIQLVPDTE